MDRFTGNFPAQDTHDLGNRLGELTGIHESIVEGYVQKEHESHGNLYLSLLLAFYPFFDVFLMFMINESILAIWFELEKQFPLVQRWDVLNRIVS